MNEEIIKALIGSGVTLIGIILPYIAVDKKNKVEIQNRREIAEKKLEKIYIRLLSMTAGSSNNNFFRNTDDINYILENAHYLDKDTRNIIMKLIEIEKDELVNNEDSIKIHRKYLKALKKTVIREHKYLSELLFGDFEKYLSRVKMDKEDIAFAKFGSISKFVFLITVILALFLWALYDFSKINIEGYNSYIVGSIVIMLTFWVMIAIFGASNYMTSILLACRKIQKSRNNVFSIGDTVPKSGYYKCKICNNEEVFSESLTFEGCQNTKNHKKNLTSHSLYIWETKN